MNHPYDSNAVVSIDVEKRQARVAVSVGLSVTLHISSMLSKLVNLAAISYCSLQIHDPSLEPLVSVSVVSRDAEKGKPRLQCQLAYQ